MTEWDLAYMRRRVQPTDADIDAIAERMASTLSASGGLRAFARAVLAAQPAPAEPVIPLGAIRPMAVKAIRAVTGCPDIKGNGRYLVDEMEDLARAAVLAAQPAPAEPVALESVHLTRDMSGMCTVRINGRTAIRDNGDIIDHTATLEWFAQPAPVPLTNEQIAECAEASDIRTELWNMGSGSLVYSDYCSGIPRADFTNFVRAIERAIVRAAAPEKP